MAATSVLASFPVLSGFECLTLLRERDEANERAAEAVTARWQAAEREVFDAWPNRGKDINDAVRGSAA